MKILESYKKMAKSMLTEHAWDRKFGEPLVTLEDVMKEAESMKLQPKGGGKTVIFKDKDNYEKAKSSGDYEEPEETDDGGEKEDPSGKLGGGDFDRKSFTGPQGDEPEGMYGEPDTTGGDPDDSWDDEEGRAKPSGEGGDEYGDSGVRAGSLGDDDDARSDAMDILQGARGSFSDFRDDHEDLFNALTDDDIDSEEKTKIFMHAMGESKKYKEVKEHAWDRKFGEPLPTLADVMKVKEEKKVTKKHILREMYEKIGGK